MVAVPALVLVGGASSAMTLLLTHDAHGHGTQAAASTSSTGGSATTGTKANKADAKAVLGGTITAQSGSTWTLKTGAGKTVTVDLGGQTKFGTKAAPSSATQFHDGSRVHVVGKHEGTAVQATRVTPLATGSSSSGTAKTGGTAG